MILHADAFDPLDPNGNITIKWDVMSWTPDGYLVPLLTPHLTSPLSNNIALLLHIHVPAWQRMSSLEFSFTLYLELH